MGFEGWVILNSFTLLVLIVLLIMFSKRGIKLKMGRMYTNILICSIALILADSIARIGDGQGGVLTILSYFGNLVLYLFDPTLVLYAVGYVDCWMDEKSKSKRTAFIKGFRVFAIINAVVVFLDQVLGFRWLYYYQSGIYHRGQFFMVRAALLLVFISFIMIYAVFFRNSILSDYRKTLFVLPLFAMAGTFVQIFTPGFATTYAGVTLACLIVFISFQYNDVNVDLTTGILNSRGLEMRLDDMIEACVSEEKSFSSTLLTIDNLASVTGSRGKDGEKAVRTFADMVVSIFGDGYAIGRFGEEGICVISNDLTPSDLESKIRVVKICVEKTKKRLGWDSSVKLSSSIQNYDPGTGQSPENYKNQIKELMKI